MLRFSLASIIFLLCYFQGNSQLPVQLFAGTKAFEYNFLWDKDLDARGRVNLFNFTFFNVDYNNRNKNSYEIYQVATYNISPKWGIAGGGRFSAGVLSPQLAVSFQLETTDLYLNIFPTLQYLEAQNTMGYSLFALLFYQPRLNNTWKMFNQITLEPLFFNKGHIYSYQQVRVGLDYRGWFQFGVGSNFEQIGKSYEFRQNYGLFIRKELN